MLAVIHATAPDMMFNDLMADLARHGIRSHVYGMGEEWHGFKDKLKTAYRAACEHPDETILFLDGFDTRVIGQVVPVAEQFPLFSAEKRCWPDPGLADQYIDWHTPWKFLNSGAYIAESSWIRRVIERNPIPDELASDQRYWTARYLRPDNRTYLDADCTLFQSTDGSPRQQWADYGGRLTNLSTMTTPSE